MKLLLLSNSTMVGKPYLQWPQEYLIDFLKQIKTAVFVPYAGVTISYNDYYNEVKSGLKGANIELLNLAEEKNKKEALRQTDCIVVGGGNTFKLLQTCYGFDIVDTIKQLVSEGKKYIGWSAGANLACPTIKTTNDMPICYPPSIEALGLIDFQINAHYTEKNLHGHGGESRMQRLEEYLVENPESTIVALPEGCLLEINNDNITLHGEQDALIIRREFMTSWKSGEQRMLNLDLKHSQ